jgi:hypothetical protein
MCQVISDLPMSWVSASRAKSEGLALGQPDPFAYKKHTQSHRVEGMKVGVLLQVWSARFALHGDP